MAGIRTTRVTHDDTVSGYPVTGLHNATAIFRPIRPLPLSTATTTMGSIILVVSVWSRYGSIEVVG